jgi:hypothetical protein
MTGASGWLRRNCTDMTATPSLLLLITTTTTTPTNNGFVRTCSLASGGQIEGEERVLDRGPTVLRAHHLARGNTHEERDAGSANVYVEQPHLCGRTARHMQVRQRNVPSVAGARSAFLPWRARDTASCAATVDLPTPPLPDRTSIFRRMAFMRSCSWLLSDRPPPSVSGHTCAAFCTGGGAPPRGVVDHCGTSETRPRGGRGAHTRVGGEACLAEGFAGTCLAHPSASGLGSL